MSSLERPTSAGEANPAKQQNADPQAKQEPTDPPMLEIEGGLASDRPVHAPEGRSSVLEDAADHSEEEVGPQSESGKERAQNGRVNADTSLEREISLGPSIRHQAEEDEPESREPSEKPVIEEKSLIEKMPADQAEQLRQQWDSLRERVQALRHVESYSVVSIAYRRCGRGLAAHLMQVFA